MLWKINIKNIVYVIIDTDSYIYDIITDYVYRDIKDLIDKYNISNFMKGNITVNCKLKRK